VGDIVIRGSELDFHYHLLGCPYCLSWQVDTLAHDRVIDLMLVLIYRGHLTTCVSAWMHRSLYSRG
jgi:hypothetical protein